MAPWAKFLSLAPVRGLGMPHPLPLLRPRVRLTHLRLALAHTFPSLTAPAHALHHAPLHTPHLASRLARAPAAGPATLRARLAGSARPRTTPASSRNVAHVGLGTARGFASGPAANLPANVPVALRAFAGMADDERPRRRRASRLAFAFRRDGGRRAARRANVCSIDSVDVINPGVLAPALPAAASDDAAALSHFFPLPAPAAADPALLQPEHLVTPGRTAVLAIPLAPDLANLLAPLAIPYAEAELGARTLARLTHGVLPLHDAFMCHAAHRVYPLLHKLDALGVLHCERARARLEAATGPDGHADVLRVVFDGRSWADVRRVLGDSLKDEDEGRWWFLTEREDGMRLSPEVAQAVQADWAGETGTGGNLVMPAPNEDAPRTPESSYSWPADASPRTSPAWASGTSTPLSLPSADSGMPSPRSPMSPISRLDLGDSLTSLDPSDASLTDAAFESALSATLARLADPAAGSLALSVGSFSSAGSDLDDAHWHVPPSDADVDVELSDAEMGASVWSTASDAADVDAALEGEMDASWTGAGAGFGFAAW